MKTEEVLSLSFLVLLPTLELQASIIYGKDDRVEIHEASAFHQTLARSVATMVAGRNLFPHPSLPGFLQIKRRSLVEWILVGTGEKGFPDDFERQHAQAGLCEKLKFQDQPNSGECSGFLIGPDLLVTASHCVATAEACDQKKWVFDYQVDQRDGQAGAEIAPESVFACKAVVSWERDLYKGVDYALIQLDRAAAGRAPLTVRTGAKISDGASVSTIGSPLGLPLKFTAGARVKRNDSFIFFMANLDTFHGSSGSPVFGQDGQVEGVLVGGDNDFVFNEEKNCIEAKVCVEDDCRGEDVMRMSAIPEFAVMPGLFASATGNDIPRLGRILERKNLWIDIYGKDRLSALGAAALAGNHEAMVLLIKRGADATLADEDGNQPLHHLARRLTRAHATALRGLLGAGASLEARNGAGRTPLLEAAHGLNRSGLEILLKEGGDVEAVDGEGESALFAFTRENDLATVMMLIKAGARPLARNVRGETAGDLALAAGFSELHLYLTNCPTMMVLTSPQ